MGQIIHTKIQLREKSTGSAIQHVLVKLYDKDPINDDLLGEGTPDVSGCVSIAFDQDKIKSSDSMLEKLPDLYFKVLRDNKEVYTSPVSEDTEGTFSIQEGNVIDLGSYLISIG